MPRQQARVAHTLEGFRFLMTERNRVLLGVTVALTGSGIVSGAGYALIVVLAARVFHVGGQGADFINGMYGIGSLVGGLVIGRLVGRRSLAPVLLTMGLADCIMAMLFGFSPTGVLPFLCMAVIGLLDTSCKVVGVTVIQIAAPRRLLGRVYAAFESSLVVGQVAGAVAVGPLILWQGPRLATFWLAAAALVCLLVSVPWLLRLERALGLRVFLQNVGVLADLAAASLDELEERFVLERYGPGTVIVREGDQGDTFYIIKRGQVNVLAEGHNGKRVHIATLARTDFFGEIALLKAVPRTATVQADGQVEVYSLTRVDFEHLLEQSAGVRQSLDGASEARELDLQMKVAGML